ncbi:putative quinol monooxygenase [Marinobacterium jannaschii]|uniref:putative quinol monooxygenase n=1 Tax=Marinobacterium jannaschii TaxID=64970 RepID=UPI00048407A3|nr:putative quinol monooxygenase [Marinobacterium jannaschii]
MYCIVVKNQLKPGCRDAYLAAMLPNAKASVEHEPGCLVFDVLEAREEPDTFYLYEIYQSEAALQAHKETGHYLSSRPLIADLLQSTSVLRADVISTHPDCRPAA